MFEGITWVWTVLIGATAGLLFDLFDRGAKNGVYGGILSGALGGFPGGLILVSIIGEVVGT